MLVHFTNSLETLDSIVRNGFLFLHNETGVLGPLLKEIYNVDGADDHTNGMVCFTELTGHLREHQKMFGEFGIGVSKSWLQTHGASKVQYIDISGQKFQEIVARVRSVAPKKFGGVPIKELLLDPDKSFRTLLSLIGPYVPTDAYKANRPYYDLIAQFPFTQVQRDIAQREWRVVNPNPYTFVGEGSKQAKIDLLVNCINDKNVHDSFEGMVNYTIDGKLQLGIGGGKNSLVLRIPIGEICAIYCPEDFKDQITDALLLSGLANIPVVTPE
jgi:abortive phage resistance protein AbiGi (putative antitoxin)